MFLNSLCLMKPEVLMVPSEPTPFGSNLSFQPHVLLHPIKLLLYPVQMTKMALPVSESLSLEYFCLCAHGHSISSNPLWRLIYTVLLISSLLCSLEVNFTYSIHHILSYLSDIWDHILSSTTRSQSHVGENVCLIYAFPTVSRKCLIHFRYPINNSHWVEHRNAMYFLLLKE